MKVQIETKFNIGDKVQLIYADRLWHGAISSVLLETSISEEVEGYPVYDNTETYMVEVEFREDSQCYEKIYGPFDKDRLMPVGESIPVCEDEKKFKF